jgi:hypothetical protein
MVCAKVKFKISGDKAFTVSDNSEEKMLQTSFYPIQGLVIGFV